MKKILAGAMCLALMFLASPIKAEMVWVGLHPIPKASSMSSEAAIPTYINTDLAVALEEGQTITIQVNDSSANADSTWVTFYSRPINTEGVVSATGEINIMALSDTSTGAFTDYGDSVYAMYAIVTGNIPYDTSCDFDITAYTDLTATSGAVSRRPVTLVAATANVDTLFKAFTWFEVTFIDTTRWMDNYTQEWRITGTGAHALTIAGTYNTTGVDYYKFWIVDPGGDDDSIGWCHSTAAGVNSGTVDSVAITGSAQNLDSGMTINFDATTGHTDKDTFMFVASDSLWYGKQSVFTVRMGLNLQRGK